MPVLEVADACAVSPSKRTRTETNPADERPILRFAKLSEHATTPSRGSAKAAGYDLYRLVIFNIYSQLKVCLCSTLHLLDASRLHNVTYRFQCNLSTLLPHIKCFVNLYSITLLSLQIYPSSCRSWTYLLYAVRHLSGEQSCEVANLSFLYFQQCLWLFHRSYG